MRWLRGRGIGRGDGGFTVTEVMISTALAALVSAAITGMLVSQTNAERDVTTFTVNHEEVRQTLVALQRDLRSAEPLIAVGTTKELENKLDLKMYESVQSTTPFHVRWRLDTTTDELLREEVNSSGTVTATTWRLRGVANGDLAIPVFAYFRADETKYELDPAISPGLTPGDVAYCTVRVAIDLRARPNGGREPVRLVSDVQLRNKLPGADECPPLA